MISYPKEGDTYVPGKFEEPPEVTIEVVREKGEMVLRSEDGTKATYCVKQGLFVTFVGVTLSPEGKVLDFISRFGGREYLMTTTPVKEGK